MMRSISSTNSSLIPISRSLSRYVERQQGRRRRRHIIVVLFAETRRSTLSTTTTTTTTDSVTSSNDTTTTRSTSTAVGNWFHETSGRTQRRKRRMEHRRLQRLRKQEYLDEREHEENDTRTVKDILFPTPQFGVDDDDDPSEVLTNQNQQQKHQWPRSISGWYYLFKEAWKIYRGTWNGFWTSKGFFVEDPKDQQADAQAEEEGMDINQQASSIKKKKDDITANVKRNTEFITDESEQIRTQIKDITGISNKEDIRVFAGDMMKLATQCVKEFMNGYRKGRDDETEKMLTEYFQDIEEEQDGGEETDNNKTRRRRKRKRRILAR